MRNVATILNNLPPKLHEDLLRALEADKAEVVRSMSRAADLLSMGRAQGKHEFMTVLEQTLTRGNGQNLAQIPQNMSGLGQVVAHPSSGVGTP